MSSPSSSNTLEAAVRAHFPLRQRLRRVAALATDVAGAAPSPAAAEQALTAVRLLGLELEAASLGQLLGAS